MNGIITEQANNEGKVIALDIQVLIGCTIGAYFY